MNEEKDNFHVDMSGRIYEEKTIGIALVGTETKVHYGCALKSNLVKFIQKKYLQRFCKTLCYLYFFISQKY